MAVFQRPVQMAVHTVPVYHPAPRPYMRPAYVPPPRVVTRYLPGQTRTVYTPGPAVTRNYLQHDVRESRLVAGSATLLRRGRPPARVRSPDARRSLVARAGRDAGGTARAAAGGRRGGTGGSAGGHRERASAVGCGTSAGLGQHAQPASERVARLGRGGRGTGAGPGRGRERGRRRRGRQAAPPAAHRRDRVAAGVAGYMVFKKKKRASSGD